MVVVDAALDAAGVGHNLGEDRATSNWATAAQRLPDQPVAQLLHAITSRRQHCKYCRSTIPQHVDLNPYWVSCRQTTWEALVETCSTHKAVSAVAWSIWTVGIGGTIHWTLDSVCTAFMEVFEEAQPARRWLSSVQCHAGVIVQDTGLLKRWGHL